MDSVVFHLCLDLNINWPGFLCMTAFVLFIALQHHPTVPPSHIVFLCVLSGKCTPGGRSNLLWPCQYLGRLSLHPPARTQV